jgi:hypothetical protein
MTERFNANQEEVGISSSGGPAGSGLDLTALGVGVGSGQTASFQENNSSLNFEFTLRWEDVAQNLGRLQEKKYLGEFVDDMEMRDKMVEDYLSSNLVNGIVAGAGVSINRASGIVTVSSNSTKTYKVGDTGPGGGIIFFVDRFDEYSDFTYLEMAADSTRVLRTWAQSTPTNYQTTSVTGASNAGLGSGSANTAAIVAQGNSNTATCAATYCDSLTSGTKSDWYLGSIGEMQLAREVLLWSRDTSWYEGYYWSSTQADNDEAYYMQAIIAGSVSGALKSSSFEVRAIRKFD